MRELLTATHIARLPVWTGTSERNNPEYVRQRWQLLGVGRESTTGLPTFFTGVRVQPSTNNAAVAWAIDQDYDYKSIDIDTEATTANAIVAAADALTTGGIASLTSNSADTSTRTLHQITNDNAAATGATVQGLKQDSTGNLAAWHSTSAGATGVLIDSHHESASPAASDVLFRLTMAAEDAASTKTTYAKVESVIDATTSSGVSGHVAFTVTSAGTAQPFLNIYGDRIAMSSSEATEMIDAVNTNAGATGVLFNAHHNSASPAASDVIFRLSMSGEDDNSSEIEMAKLETILNDVSSGATGAHAAFTVRSAGTAQNFLNIYGDRMQLLSSEATEMIDAVNTNGGATGVIFKVHHDSGSPANSDVIFRLSMSGDDDNGSKIEYAKMEASILDVSSGADASSVSFFTRSDGAAVESLRIRYGKVLTNEESYLASTTAITDVFDRPLGAARVSDLELMSLYGSDPEQRRKFYDTVVEEGIATREPDGRVFVDSELDRKLVRGALKQAWHALRDQGAQIQSMAADLARAKEVLASLT